MFRVSLSNTLLMRADLSGATLSLACLNGAILSGADLSDADLSDADLGNADLGNADLRRANLSGADFMYVQGLDKITHYEGIWAYRGEEPKNLPDKFINEIQANLKN